MNTENKILDTLGPHLCLTQWDAPDTETIMKDIILVRKHGLAAISALAGSMTVLNNVADGTPVYCFIDDDKRLRDISDRGVTVQMYLPKKRMAEMPDGCSDLTIIPTFKLKDIEYMDWSRIILLGTRLGGFMFIDGNGKYIHRFFDFLNLIGDKFDGEVHYCAAAKSADKTNAAFRLVKKIRPNLLPKLRLFVSREFFSRGS